MALPSTGGTWAEVIAPSLNPLAVRYWQITDVLIADYFNSDGTVYNMADPSVGLGTAGVLTPFAADGISIREDLLITAPGTNQGFYHFGLLKEDATAHTIDQTIQQTPSSQYIRTVRNVLTKLDDKVNFTPIEATPLTDALQFEKPLSGGIQALGTPGYQLVRGNTDVLQERRIILLGVDTDGNLMSKVFPRLTTDKKGKIELSRKNPESLEFTYEPLPDPFSQASMWICRGGTQWLASGDLEFETTAPVVTPQTGGVTVTAQFPTPIDITDPTYTVTIQSTAGGSFTSGTVSGSPSVSGAFTTITISDLTASTAYNAIQVTATGGDVTATSLVSAPFTTEAS
jgi:hypothetical protein